jgi:hypothetical protein
MSDKSADERTTRQLVGIGVELPDDEEIAREWLWPLTTGALLLLGSSEFVGVESVAMRFSLRCTFPGPVRLRPGWVAGT